MREILERLLQSVDVPNVERAQLHWDEYRSGADSTDPAVKAAADAAFATLLAWYGASLYRHIWGFIRTDAAEDVFQDVLRKLHEKRQSPRLADFQANVLPWLRTVAIRECVDAHRRTIRRRARESKAARPENEPRSENPNELQEVLAVALARLTPEEQQAIALHYFEGHDRQQAAAILGVHRDTLGSRINAALDRLQRYIPAPTSIVVGGTLTAPAILTARPPTLTPTRLSELVAAAWDKATEAGWSIGRAAVVTMIGLTLCGAAAGWALTSESPQPEEVRAPPPAVNEPRESLRERYIRITKAEVLPRVLAAIQKLLSPDNLVFASEPRVVGSIVEIEFRPTWRIPGYFTERIRVRYDVLSRMMFVSSYIVEEGRWTHVIPETTYTFPVPTLKGWKSVTTTPFRSAFVEALEAFRQLPLDDRAEEEQVQFLFGEHGWTDRKFTIPSTAQFICGNSRTLFVWLTEMGDTGWGATFSRRIDGGGWRYAGVLPVAPIGVDETHFYSVGVSSIDARRIDNAKEPWVKVGAITGRIAPGGLLAAAEGKLFYRGSDSLLLMRAAHNLEDSWTELPAIPFSLRGFAFGGGRLFVVGEANLYELPLNQAGAKWRTSGRGLPKPSFLTFWGNRVLHIPAEPGPIQSRLVSDPDAPWEVIGHVHVPRE